MQRQSLVLRPHLNVKFSSNVLRRMSLRGGEANEVPRPKTSHVIAVGTICGAILILNEMNLVRSRFPANLSFFGLLGNLI